MILFLISVTWCKVLWLEIYIRIIILLQRFLQREVMFYVVGGCRVHYLITPLGALYCYEVCCGTRDEVERHTCRDSLGS